MEQKTTWMRFLPIGISALSLVVGCGEAQVDYRVRADYLFINETPYAITYAGDGNRFNVGAKDTTRFTSQGNGPETVNKDSFESPLHTYCYPCLIRFENIRCDTIKDIGPAKITNFEARQLSERHMEYTYRFTEKDFQKAKQCK